MENNELYWGTGISTDTCAWSKMKEPAVNNWHHIVVTYSSANGLSGNKEIFIDGNLVKSCSFTEKAAPNARLTVGSMVVDAQGTRSYFQGMLDEIRIYNRKLSSTEVTTLYMQPTVGINEKTANAPLNVYPNPVKDLLYIGMPENALNCRAEITNMLGQVIFNHPVKENKIDVSQMESGFYILKITGPGNSFTQKIYKQ
jgi:hypothetical protein